MFTLTDEEVKVPWFGLETFTHTLERQDRLVITLRKESKLPIHMLEIRELANDSVVARFMRPQSLVEQVIPIKNGGDYEVSLKNYAPIRRKAWLNLKRVPKIPAHYYRDSIAIDTVITFREIKTPIQDTIPETLMETSLTVDATLNIMMPSRTCVELPVPEQSNYYWSYWMASELALLDEYLAIGEEPPLSWQRAEVNDPLIAYGLGLTDTLPERPNLDRVQAFLTDAYGAKTFQEGRPVTPHNEFGPRGYLGNYGTIGWNAEILQFPVFMCFENGNRVSPVNLQLKTMGFIVEQTIDIQEIEKMEIKEEVIKIKVIPPDPGPSPAKE
ncbi:MAG: hypothetical protein AAFV80_23725 [Bacteroidota bacterium]